MKRRVGTLIFIALAMLLALTIWPPGVPTQQTDYFQRVAHPG
ncbi:MAG: hypothetical protein JWQ01_4867 [Massilia sp.]|nr:hypothetical protein [Massilia sp.]